MKTTTKQPVKKQALLLLGFVFALFLFTNSINAQDIQVKGIVKGKTDDGTELLNGANIYLKNAKIVAVSNRRGEFTFPKSLKEGDILVFSYLGFLKKSIKITKNSTFLTVVLEEDDNEMLGAPQSNKPFKSKHSKQ